MGKCWNSMPPRRLVSCGAGDKNREAHDGERVTPPRPTPDMQAQMLAGMIQFFAQFARNQATVDTGARPGSKQFTRGDARLWWESASVSVNLQTLSWNVFKEVFYSKYFTEEVRSRLTREFMALSQGDSSVAEFVRKFGRGCHFVPLIANDAREKLRHFIDGLQPILRRDVRVACPTTYAVAVSRALAAE
ncbi:uncharacterized protein [Primulina huaijiensis]|uniref:uncharacterized protein n=1 Tax=Primulina huaijiensis TaxID=1492673 RepID=UPI003CC75053